MWEREEGGGRAQINIQTTGTLRFALGKNVSSTNSSTLASNGVHEKTELQTHEKLERKNVALKAFAPQHYTTNSDRNEIHWQGGLQGPRTPVASELEHIKCRKPGLDHMSSLG